MKSSSAHARKYNLEEISISFGMFDYEFIVLLGQRKHLAEYLALRFGEPAHRFELADHVKGEAWFPDNKVLAPVVWLPRRPKTALEYATLAHEALHIVFHMTRWFGVELTKESEETHAHALSYAVRTILGKLELPRKVSRRRA